jgi:hypothetical protein
MVYSFPNEGTDLDVMLADSRHSITVGTDSHKCFYDLRGQAEEMDGSAAPLIHQVEVATVKREHFPNIKQGDTAAVSEASVWSQSYTVLEVVPAGALLELLLQRV